MTGVGPTATLRRGAVLAVALLLASAAASAQVQRAHPSIPLTPAQKQRYEAMLPGLRCLVCQNESLAESQAPLAADLRYEIRGLVAKGDSDAEVKAYLVARYGEYVLYKPRFKPSTWLLWLGPFLLLGVGLAVALRRLLRRRVSAAPPTAPDDAALRRLLDENR